MATATMTVAASTPQVQPQLGPTEADIRAYRNNFKLIQQKHEKLKDLFSERLRSCIGDLLMIDEAAFKQSPLARRSVLFLFRQLKHEILVNDLDGSPLVTPWVDREVWVWEKATLDDYRKIAPLVGAQDVSPFDNQPFDIKPHLFAIDVLGSIDTLPIEDMLEGRVEKVEHKENGNGEVEQAEDTQERQLLRHLSYCFQAQLAVGVWLKKHIVGLNGSLAECRQRMEAQNVAVRKVAKQEAERAKATTEAHHVTIRAEIDSFKQETGATIAVLNNNLQDTNTQLTVSHQKQVGMQQQIEGLNQRVAADEREKAALRGEVCNLRNQDHGSDCIIC